MSTWSSISSSKVRTIGSSIHTPLRRRHAPVTLTSLTHTPVEIACKVTLTKWVLVISRSWTSWTELSNKTLSAEKTPLANRSHKVNFSSNTFKLHMMFFVFFLIFLVTKVRKICEMRNYDECHFQSTKSIGHIADAFAEQHLITDSPTIQSTLNHIF